MAVKRLLLGMRPYPNDIVNYTEDIAPFSRYHSFDYGKPGK